MAHATARRAAKSLLWRGTSRLRTYGGWLPIASCVIAEGKDSSCVAFGRLVLYSVWAVPFATGCRQRRYVAVNQQPPAAMFSIGVALAFRYLLGGHVFDDFLAASGR